MKITRIILLLLALGTGYLLLWPSPLEPKSWTPPVAPPLEGVYALNEKLAGIEKLALDKGSGPEGVVVDAQGNVYSGYDDGRVVQISNDGNSVRELGNTGGRPLGLAFGPDNSLLIADAHKGLLQLHADGRLEVLAITDGALPFGFTDDVDWRAGDDWAYFSDASWKFGYGQHIADALEHGGNGRLLAYNLKTREVRVLMRNLQFANGIAVGPGSDYVLVNITAEYRVLRYWLKGEKAGTFDVFIDNLPGFPDNITFNGKDRFWVAIFAPRDPLLDTLLPGGPFLRKVVGRLPAFLQPSPKPHAFALGLDLDGKVVVNLQHEGKAAYSPITCVREVGEYLYFGSLKYPAIGRIALKQVAQGS